MTKVDLVICVLALAVNIFNSTFHINYLYWIDSALLGYLSGNIYFVVKNR